MIIVATPMVPPDHPLVRQAGEITWKELQSYRIVGFSADLGMQHQLTQTSALSQDFRDPRYRVSNTSTIATLLARGVGVSAMSALAAKRAPLDSLSFRPLKEPTLTRTVGFLTRAARSLSPAATSMMAEVRQAAPGLSRFPGVHVIAGNPLREVAPDSEPATLQDARSRTLMP